MVAHYDRLGIQFAYPDNWPIMDEELENTPQGVSVQSPSGAFWDVKIFSNTETASNVCDQALDAMRELYEDLEFEAVSEQQFDLPTVGYDLEFFCSNFLVTAQLRCYCIDERLLLVTIQAESQDFIRQRAVFGAITKSLLSD